MTELSRHLAIFEKMVNMFGTNIQYKRYLGSVYQDPVRNLNPSKNYGDLFSIKVNLQYHKSRSMESFIQGDLNISIPGSISFTPSIEDKITHDNKTFSILNIKPYKIGTGIVYYEVMARAAK